MLTNIWKTISLIVIFAILCTACSPTPATPTPQPNPRPPQPDIDVSTIAMAGVSIPPLPDGECQNFRKHIMEDDGKGGSHWLDFGKDIGVLAILSAISNGRNVNAWANGGQVVIAFDWAHKYVFLKWGTGNATAYYLTWEKILREVSGTSWKKISSQEGLKIIRDRLTQLLGCYRGAIPQPVPERVPEPKTEPQKVTTPMPIVAKDPIRVPNGVYNPEGIPLPTSPVPVYYYGLEPLSSEQLAILLLAGAVIVVVVLIAPQAAILVVFAVP